MFWGRAAILLTEDQRSLYFDGLCNQLTLLRLTGCVRMQGHSWAFSIAEFILSSLTSVWFHGFT